jgi:hypothetical protein
MISGSDACQDSFLWGELSLLRTRGVRRAAMLAVTTATILVPASAAMAAPGVDPKNVELLLHPGDSTTITKTVTTPEILPKPDIYFLADTTGSMGPAINNVKIRSSAPDSTRTSRRHSGTRTTPRSARRRRTSLPRSTPGPRPSAATCRRRTCSRCRR